MTRGKGAAKTAGRGATSGRVHEVTRASLARMPLPTLDERGDKNDRGRVLVVGGCMSVPGATLLAGVAALRAGAGKLQLATVAPAALPLGLAVPEALVIALPASRSGQIAGERAGKVLRQPVTAIDALAVGPGMTDDRGAHALLAAVIPHMSDTATLVLDAAGIFALKQDENLLTPLGGRAVLTPHAGEMATLLDISKDEVTADPRAVARAAADRFGAVTVLKGSECFIATPDGGMHRFAGGDVGLATSGSGDTLAGIIVGLAARGAEPVRAALWGVWAHAEAGNRLAKRMGKVGFLARELLAELPALVGRG